MTLIAISAMSACDSSTIKDAVDIVEGIPRKTINTSKLGINAFANDSRFGSASQQFLEVRDTLKLSQVRILIPWDDGSDPTANGTPNFRFADRTIGALPPGVSAFAVVTGAPSWMSDSSQWIGSNPRRTFVERWLKPLATRYANNPQVIGFQVWNEPNMKTDINALMGVNDAISYVEMLALASNAIKESAPGKLVISAATTAINQNYPDSLDYNKAMRDAGAQSFCDIWAFHYYSKQYERLVASGGVADFLNGLNKPLWITESGSQGILTQLAYGEEVWPYLLEKIPAIERIYIYQLTEATPSESTYGLRNLTQGASVSDLYVWLRDR
jgi:hypothetical protein